MPRRIGVCRALHAYHHYSQWRTFFEHLGLEVVLSGPTGRLEVERGVRLAPAELCLPVKAFLGHVSVLAPQVDALFLPRVVNVRMAGDCYFGCPKTIALPDLTRATFDALPPVVELVIDEQICTKERSFARVAKELGNERDSKAATRAAMVAEETAAEQTRRTGSPLHVFDSCAMRASRAAEPRLEAHTSAAPRVGVVGHPYLVFDPGLGLGVLDKLRGAGAEPMVAFPSFADIERAAGLPGSPNWFYEVELMTAARHLLDRERVDGLLLVTSFACGTGAVTNELVRKHAVHELGVPTMGLLLDEHTGEAGLITRLESFVDLLRLKRT